MAENDPQPVRSFELLARRRKLKPTGTASKPTNRLVKKAQIYLAENAYRDAAPHLAEGVAVAPEDAQTLAYLAAGYRDMASALIERAVALDPQVELGNLLAAKAAPSPQTTRVRKDYAVRLATPSPSPSPSAEQQGRPAIWPNRSIIWRDTDRTFRRYILAETLPEPGLLTPSSLVVTMGSCFAENIAIALKNLGVRVRHHRINEGLNSTIANERLVTWAIQGPSAPDGELLERKFGPAARQGILEELRTCDAYILSLGVAPIPTKPNGDFLLWLGRDDDDTDDNSPRLDGAAWRTTTPIENADSVRRIVTLLRGINPHLPIFLTLSPVPLGATFERKSAILADSVSKASLRLAIEIVMAEAHSGVRYWPSFEMVKWWGSHLHEGRAFGDDDDESRHVSKWLVKKIMSHFVDHYVQRPSGHSGAIK